MDQKGRPAIGIIRVSEVKGRNGDSFMSPEIQRERIERDCEGFGLRLDNLIEELDVSGGNPLAKRPVAQALRAVEDGRAEAIIFAYRDRVDRSIQHGGELCRRMDAAGGLLIADGHQITHSTHDGWRKATFESFLNEDQRRAVAEKMRDVHKRCVERGVAPWSQVPVGYTKRDDGVYEPADRREVALARRAFQMRDKGATIPEIRAVLKDAGIKRSERGVQVMLANRAYLGEIRFGERVNLHAHPSIIDRELFERVQRRKVPRGPKPKSDLPLARQGVLRCGCCDSRMSSAVMPQGGGYPIYRCSSSNDCPRHMVISAALAEGAVQEAVKQALTGRAGRASAATGVAEAQAELDRAQARLDATIRAFDALGGEPAAVEKLRELTEARDDACNRLHDLRAAAGAMQVAITVDDWTELSLEAQREVIRALIKRAVVNPGRGAGRIEIEYV
jgi:hypothetical protein